MTTGYDGPTSEEDEKEKSPEDRTWRVIHNRKILSDDAIYGIVELDGESIGMIRLPDMEHLGWLRERIQNS